MGYRSTAVYVFILCCFAAICHSVSSQQPGVCLLWQGVQYPNNSLLNIEFIGEGERALVCQTDRRPCCGTPPYRFGEWYYPNSSRVPIEGEGALFYRNRSDEGLVLLHQRYYSVPTNYTGLYCCVLPDANDTMHTLCVGLLPRYNLYVGGDSIIELSYNVMRYTFLCVTSGGTASFIDVNSCIVSHEQQLVGYSQLILDPLGSRYNTVLTWKSQSGGHYVCSTRSSAGVSYAVLLTEFGVGQGSCSSQIVGTLGSELTLLCLANEPVTGAVWVTPRGLRNSNNITFARLNFSDAGVYFCRGTVQDQEISSSANLKISGCNAVVYVAGNSRIGIGRSYSIICNTFQLSESNCVEDEFYIFNGSRLISRNKTTLLRTDSVSDVLINYLNKFYSCIVTLNGSNFTSNPVRIPNLIELSTPLSVNISSNLGNPIPPGSSPTLSCIVSLSPAIDVEVEVIIRWSGPTFGLNKFTTTKSILQTNAEVLTYASRATLNASGTFYDSGQYFCSVVINPLNNRDVIQGTSAVHSPGISVLFSYPRQPVLHNQRDFNWIYISWENNQESDNITKYEVEYSYAGECSEINQNIITEMVGRTDSSYNITGLGEYHNYSITLTAINDTGRSPPNKIFVATLSSIPTQPPQGFVAAMEFSTNITVQWQRVRCAERRSEIIHYILQYSLDSARVTEERVRGTSDEDRMFTANRLQLQSTYTFTIAAVNSAGQRGPNTTITAMTSAPESVPFQLQLSGVHNCLQWRISDPEDKVHNVLVGIASSVNQQCPLCELEHTNITDGEFQCFPGSPNQVTFRAKVHDRAQATAREVIMHIEQWILSSDMVTLPVHHARLKINSTCVVLLGSLDDPECPGYLIPPSQLTTSITSDIMTSDAFTTTAQPTTNTISSKRENIDTNQSQLDAGTIVGGTVAIVFIICITIGVMVILIYLLYSVFKLKHIQTTEQSALKKPAESKSEHEITVPAKTAATAKVEKELNTRSPDEMYEEVEMQVTSSAKARYAPAQMSQEGSAKTRHVETEAAGKDSAGKGDNLEAYEIMNVA